VDWSNYPNFKRSEFACKHTGECHMHPVFMTVLQQIRTAHGKPIFISSGYRDPSHPVESMKEQPGEHCHGMAADIICHGQEAQKLIALALEHGIERIGIHQKGRGSERFIHLGMGDKLTNLFQVALWTY
jgi:zinc D-Ala-D-Ala carboxypeptidase